MKDKSPSPADKIQVRIAKDKREFERLTKAAQKRLVEGHSPVVYDYLDYQLADANYNLTGADRAMAAAYESSAFDMETYFTCAEKDTLNTIDIWSKEYQQILHDAEMRSFGYLYDKEDEVERDFGYARGDVDVIVNMLGDDADDEEKRDEDIIIDTIDDDADDVKDDLGDGEGRWYDFATNWMDAIVSMPTIITNVAEMLDSFVNLDPEKFIEDNIELIKAQKRLQKRLAEETE